MNEQEAIEQLSGEYLVSMTGKETPARVRYHNEALDAAIAALKEVQEYHDTGHTPKMVRELRRGYLDAHKKAVQYATKLDEYHDLGSFEACKAAVEKQTPKKMKEECWMYTQCECGHLFSERNGDGYFHVPEKKKTKYCPDCGQRLEWEND